MDQDAPNDMSDWESRRREDPKLDAILDIVEQAATREDLAAHVAEYHAFKKGDLVRMVDEHQALMEQAERKEVLLNRIVSVLDGEDIYGLDGTVVDHKPGMRIQVQELYAHEKNGGLRSKRAWGRGQWAAITALLTLGTATVALLAEIVRNL